jgi:hypothetical protein
VKALSRAQKANLLLEAGSPTFAAKPAALGTRFLVAFVGSKVLANSVCGEYATELEPSRLEAVEVACNGKRAT